MNETTLQRIANYHAILDGADTLLARWFEAEAAKPPTECPDPTALKSMVLSLRRVVDIRRTLDTWEKTETNHSNDFDNDNCTSYEKARIRALMEQDGLADEAAYEEDPSQDPCADASPPAKRSSPRIAKPRPSAARIQFHAPNPPFTPSAPTTSTTPSTLSTSSTVSTSSTTSLHSDDAPKQSDPTPAASSTPDRTLQKFPNHRPISPALFAYWMNQTSINATTPTPMRPIHPAPPNHRCRGAPPGWLAPQSRHPPPR